MKLPGAEKAIVSREKIINYLLNPAHPDNGGKAEFFTQFGFRREQWEILATTLKNLAATGEVANATESSHGKKYIIVGRIQSSGGKSPTVRTIWIVDKGQDTARLVTAYPRKP
ncbi:MAG: DUF6883 domain-containing protein [Limisphaerales bacterium]